MSDIEKDAKAIVDNALEFKNLKLENSLLKAVLKYRKPCVTCDKDIATQLTKIASDLDLNYEVTNVGKSQCKFMAWKDDDLFN